MPITGDDIIAEVLRNAEAGQFRMRKTVVLPSVYHIYLQQSDFDLIRPVMNALRGEVRAALAEQTDAWNKKAQGSKIGKLLGLESAESGVQFRILDPDYSIEFFPDVEGALEQGDMEIRSELASAPAPEFDGAMTRQVTRRNGQVSYSEPAANTVDPDATLPVVRPPAAGNSESVFGRLRYTDDGKEQEFAVTKNEVAIGRGGKTVWVDVRLNAPADVSREHCRIRRDGASGRFYITDLSQFGTAVDGRKLPSGTELELPAKARIDLAGVVGIEWEKA